jgi:hypothetical protein
VDIFIWLSTGGVGLVFGGLFWWQALEVRRERRRARIAGQLARRYLTAAKLMGKHSLPDRDGVVRVPGEEHHRADDAITVPTLLARAIAADDPLRLAWSLENLDVATGLVRPYAQDELPTAVLPVVRVEDEGAPH